MTRTTVVLLNFAMLVGYVTGAFGQLMASPPVVVASTAAAKADTEPDCDVSNARVSEPTLFVTDRQLEPEHDVVGKPFG